MNIVRCLETIDRLCASPLPAAHGWSDVGREGPGYYLTESGAGDPDGASGELTAEDVGAYREGTAQLLNERWGETRPWDMLTLRVRGERGERRYRSRGRR
ncbi:hypothetical protein [Streptomyces sp. PSKA30]|uniref:hypothetical protein n=1 Tax=Streptomyces sp. PSKA30 TaxID=2874597 RepID=UPI001CD07D82|nr:hypothetical protein [Streptomyces sp. PSKA30]MBZ9642475.1 hypothetical protein [Streptomyces sp. PSKA30]